MNEFFERNHYYVWKYCWHILQPEGHHSVLKTSPFGHEGGLAPIFRCNLDMVISWEPIRERVHFLSTNILQDFICKGGWERVMNAGILQFSEIQAYSNFSLLFVLLYRHKTHLARFFNMFNNSCCKHLVLLFADFLLILQIQMVGTLLNWLRVRLQSYLHHPKSTWIPFNSVSLVENKSWHLRSNSTNLSTVASSQ